MTPPSTPFERRREPRELVQLKLAIQGYASNGTAWEETAMTQDASAAGLAFLTQQPMVKGQVLHLAVPLPKAMRQFDHNAASYYVYAIVRNVLADDSGIRIGVMFFGKDPPRGFERTPGARFLLPSDLAPETLPAPAPPPPPLRMTERKPAPPDPTGHRRHERFDIFVNLQLEQMDEWGAVLAEEMTVTENLSAGGTRCPTSLPLHRGDVLCVREVGGPFEARAQIVNSYLGADKVQRLNLKFLDERSPAHLLRKH
jgi:hypothetical protein